MKKYRCTVRKNSGAPEIVEIEAPDIATAALQAVVSAESENELLRSVGVKRPKIEVVSVVLVEGR